MAMALISGPSAAAANVPAMTAEVLIANADRLTQRRTNADCRREAAAAILRGDPDIIVCAPEQDQALPVPEVYGPLAGSTDGAAVRPEGEPCGVSLQRPCFEGVDVLAAVRFIGDKLLDIINPDRDLGAATPIPDRYRGANR
jgi:hypothetical protein